jgi:23S rRNA A2030 N6-methylase RlmJ
MLDSRGRALIVIDSPSADPQSLDAVVEALKAMLRARAGTGA